MKKTVTYKEWLELVPIEWCEKYDLRFKLGNNRTIIMRDDIYLHLPKKFQWEETESTHDLTTDKFALSLWKNVKEVHLTVFE